jgi:hypothetical protein
LLRPLAALALLASAGPALAQASALRPAAPAHVVTGLSACIAAMRPGGGVEQSKLTGAGWRKGTAEDAKGKAMPMPFAIYGRKDANVVLLTDPAGKGACTVLARIERPESAPAVVQALAAHLKAQPKRDKNNNLIWLAGRTAVQLAATGDRAKPALRVAVIQLAEKK